jgi:hypothetical protein
MRTSKASTACSSQRRHCILAPARGHALATTLLPSTAMSSVPVLRTAPHVSSTFLDRGGVLEHLSGPALGKCMSMSLNATELVWSGGATTSAWELVEVTVYSADGRRSWPYFTQQTMLGCEGMLELNCWRATGVHRVAGHGATVSFTLRAALPTVQSFKHGASEPVVCEYICISSLWYQI